MLRKEVEVAPELERKLKEIRHYLHQYPELSFQEFQTSEFIASCLDDWGIAYRRVGETGIVVDIIGGKGEGPHIAIRADIDALPIEEKTGLSFASCHPGVMHACGHDGHTTILLGVIYQLHQHRGQWNGRVRGIFQPGEEADGAALRMIEQGVLEQPRVDQMLALHLWPHLPHGTIGVRYGAVTASCDDFEFEIQGKGGHSARPHQSIDAIMISAQILQALSFYVTKANNPVDPVVVHVGVIEGGSASNVVADRVVLKGTVRSVSQATRTKIKKELTQLVENVAKTHGGNACVTFTDGHPPVINDEEITKTLEKSAREWLGESVHILKEPSMGADDFGAFAERVPSTYFRLGVGKAGSPVVDLHHPGFQFDDTIIPIGVTLVTRTVLKLINNEERA
ncbi:M20 family metallopeptidase [Ammoniphilus sp. CFH 90114]|uniref:M20 metallopeptidase family protein n=1 Tax=Ammoniphilus sp. CFH 90114 TaxID=2493665 RepID=UPI00100E898C|nr:M20 family metallopeptidase [Ammoniphilus sp. CFH 90114]RXT06540.1 amidohydrolase [Ammoniphilus sp. CFH 90114]